MLHYKLGKKPARVGAVKLRLAKYLNLAALPTRPSSFSYLDLVKNPWGMLGNDQYGDCYWAGSCHETMLFNAIGGKQVDFTTADALNAYSSATGFNQDDSNSDQGTDMQAGAQFRQKTGIVDASGNVHKVAAYVSIEPGNWEEHLTAAWLFGGVGVGLELPSSAETQFDNGQPWSVVKGSKIEGGHYVSLLAGSDDALQISTWGGIIPMVQGFLTKYNDESICYLSDEVFNGTKDIEGFDLAQLQADLADLQGS